MARYRVELVQTVIETAVVYVEATNEQQAEDLALESAQTGNPEAHWKFKDTLDAVEALSVTEVRTSVSEA